MKSACCAWILVACFIASAAWSSRLQAGEPSPASVRGFESSIQSWFDSEKIVGAQVIAGTTDRIYFEKNLGVRSVADTSPVDEDTLFCIGSCSKPIASALILTMVAEGMLKLDEGIDHTLPAYGNLKTDEGASARAPTLRELLCHRSGIYSQKKGMKAQQAVWIRNFNLTLADAVSKIAQEPLRSLPGEEYAYSGAGYCVIGRVAEVVAEKDFDSLLQERICKPLALKRTTYFPDPASDAIATGSFRGKPNPQTPHHFDPFNLPLIGGSLYTTSTDAAKFLAMVLSRGTSGQDVLLSESMFDEYVGQQVPGQTYGLGWSLRLKDGKTAAVSHTGALASGRAVFMVDFEAGRYAAVLYTLGEVSRSDSAGRAIGQLVKTFLSR
ncbi:MAG: beta-lactamase family protein [Verrucomicrobiae bacterium]|nr:beta-lactamase family protein [Verrucomicrobiae bacterium]